MVSPHFGLHISDGQDVEHLLFVYWPVIYLLWRNVFNIFKSFVQLKNLVVFLLLVIRNLGMF